MHSGRAEHGAGREGEGDGRSEGRDRRAAGAGMGARAGRRRVPHPRCRSFMLGYAGLCIMQQQRVHGERSNAMLTLLALTRFARHGPHLYTSGRQAKTMSFLPGKC